MSSILDEIVEDTERELVVRKRQLPLDDLIAQTRRREAKSRPFAEAISRPGISAITEFKRRSPSRGEIRPGADVVQLATAYERAGAAALSVLTEPRHFAGSLDDLRAAREVTDLPILRKDFIIDPYQVYESLAVGADAILLIVAALEPEQLVQLDELAYSLDLDVLVEVHTEEELETALELEAELIGINNRNLANFKVDLQTTFDLLSDVPAGVHVVSESGIHHREQVEELERVGVDGILIGESLMREDDPEKMLRNLLGKAKG